MGMSSIGQFNPMTMSFPELTAWLQKERIYVSDEDVAAFEDRFEAMVYEDEELDDHNFNVPYEEWRELTDPLSTMSPPQAAGATYGELLKNDPESILARDMMRLAR